MSKRFDRTEALIGADNLRLLRDARVLLVGLGGVGGAAAETLVRSGVGHVVFADGDTFETSNLNRQILCTDKVIGRNKAEVAAERAAEIDPDIDATAFPVFVTKENMSSVIDGKFDYAVDAIDDLDNKIEFIVACKTAGIPIISAMGAGNRLDCDFKVTDVYKTEYDPFARIVRRRLREAAVQSLDVVCASSVPEVKSSGSPSSIAAPPMVMGAMLANFVVRRLIGR